MGHEFKDLSERHLQIRLRDEGCEVHSQVKYFREVPSELAEKYVEELQMLIDILQGPAFEEEADKQ